MESTISEIAIDCLPYLRVHKNGRVDRLFGTQTVPPGLDPKTNVDSKDVVFSPETGQYVRLYIPNNGGSPIQKLPLLVYFHGGAFFIETASSPTYHNYLNSLVAEGNIVAVSVDYRRAPEHPIPAAYHDSWAALTWVASHYGGNGPEEWLNNSYIDFDKVYLSGDSAGGNIAHHIAIKIGKEKLQAVNLAAIILIHPYFWGTKPIDNESRDPAKRARVDRYWRLASPTTSGSDDPWINPVDDQSFASLICTRVLVCVAEKDILRHRGWYYYEQLKKSGWEGEAEFMEAIGEKHLFHLQKPTCENAVTMLKTIAAFMNQTLTIKGARIHNNMHGQTSRL